MCGRGSDFRCPVHRLFTPMWWRSGVEQSQHVLDVAGIKRLLLEELLDKVGAVLKQSLCYTEVATVSVLALDCEAVCMDVPIEEVLGIAAIQLLLVNHFDLIASVRLTEQLIQVAVSHLVAVAPPEPMQTPSA